MCLAGRRPGGSVQPPERHRPGQPVRHSSLNISPSPVSSLSTRVAGARALSLAVPVPLASPPFASSNARAEDLNRTISTKTKARHAARVRVHKTARAILGPEKGG